MEFVADANILFSALIKEGKTRELLLNDNLILNVPEGIIEEFLEHIDELQEKTNVESEILKSELRELIILSKINIIPKDEFSEFINEAKNISLDIDDVMYFALALKLKCPIWSNDKKLKQQDKVRVYSTDELIKEFDL